MTKHSRLVPLLDVTSHLGTSLAATPSAYPREVHHQLTPRPLPPSHEPKSIRAIPSHHQPYHAGSRLEMVVSVPLQTPEKYSRAMVVAICLVPVEVSSGDVSFHAPSDRLAIDCTLESGSIADGCKRSLALSKLTGLPMRFSFLGMNILECGYDGLNLDKRRP